MLWANSYERVQDVPTSPSCSLPLRSRELASGSTSAPARCSSGLSPPSFGSGVGEALGWDHLSCRWYGRGRCTPSLNGHSTTCRSLATVANTLCENREGWVNITAHLLQPVGLIAKRWRWSVREMGQTHHKYRPQQLSNVIIRCNHMLKESMNISLGEGRRAYGGTWRFLPCSQCVFPKPLLLVPVWDRLLGQVCRADVR